MEIVVIKGTFSGLDSLIAALILGETIPAIQWLLCVLALGFVAYGLSIHFYIMAQKDFGAAKQVYIIRLHRFWEWHSVCCFWVRNQVSSFI